MVTYSLQDRLVSQLETYIDPTTTDQLLNNLSLAIDETKLVIRLNELNNQIFKLKSSQKETGRSEFLKKEMIKLKVQLNYLRDKVIYSTNRK